MLVRRTEVVEQPFLLLGDSGLCWKAGPLPVRPWCGEGHYVDFALHWKCCKENAETQALPSPLLWLMHILVASVCLKLVHTYSRGSKWQLCSKVVLSLSPLCSQGLSTFHWEVRYCSSVLPFCWSPKMLGQRDVSVVVWVFSSAYQPLPCRLLRSVLLWAYLGCTLSIGPKGQLFESKLPSWVQRVSF